MKHEIRYITFTYHYDLRTWKEKVRDFFKKLMGS